MLSVDLRCSLQVASVDVPSLSSYIKNAFIGASAAALDEALSHSANVDCMQKFIGDPQVPMLVVDRIITRGCECLEFFYHMWDVLSFRFEIR